MKPTLRSRAILMLLGVTLFASSTVHANNITTSTGSLTSNTGTSVLVQFNVTWENSWRINPDRWDAAWVFVKYRRSDGLWRHASLSNTGHTAPSGSVITTGLVNPASAYNASTNPGAGAFIYRSADGSGTFSANGVQLLWNYSVNGVSLADVQEVRVFAIEMVNVPQGAFAAGSGGSETDAFTLTTIGTANATTAPTGSGALGGQSGGYPTGQTAPTSAAWPNGFSAFYCMKYELSQQAYVDFLNTLTYDQQVGRTRVAPTTAPNNFALVVGGVGNQMRNGVMIQTSGVASTTPAIYACNLNLNGVYGEAADGKDLACNYLSGGDQGAYLDWSGLRIMTELEYEKVCRGSALPLANEYPWNTTAISSGSYSLTNAGTTSEGVTSISTAAGNASYGIALPGGGPFRGGIFAANASNTGRVTAGAGHYGIMELAGNLCERVVELWSPQGRAYTGTHGNGALAANGDPDAVSWSAFGVWQNLRGGCWHTFASDLRVSDRIYSSGNTALGNQAAGCRGVRTQ